MKDAPPRMLVAMGILATAITVLGLRPDLLLRGVFAPGLHTWGLHADLLDHYLEAQFLSPADLMSVVIAFAIGVAIFAVGMKFGLFHLHAPAWFGVNFWYVAAARGLVRGCRVVQSAYERYLEWLPGVLRPAFHATVEFIAASYQACVDALARTWRTARGHVRGAWHRSERRWHRLVVGLATHGPKMRDESFLRGAAITLALERQACVRSAVHVAEVWLCGHSDMEPERRATLLSDVRDAATYIAEQIRQHRYDVLADLVEHGELDRVSGSLDQVLAGAEAPCDLIAPLAFELGKRRWAGDDIADELAIEASGLVREEAFAQRLRDAATQPRLSINEWHEMGASRIQLAALWVVHVARLLSEASTREHDDWTPTEWFPAHVDAASVVETRARIQRYARDMSWNVAVILVMLLALLVTIAAGM